MNFGWGCFIFCKTIGSKIPKDYALLCHVHLLQHKHDNIIFRVKLSMCHAINDLPHSYSTYAFGKFLHYRVKCFVIYKKYSLEYKRRWFLVNFLILIQGCYHCLLYSFNLKRYHCYVYFYRSSEGCPARFVKKTSKFLFSGEVTSSATRSE